MTLFPSSPVVCIKNEHVTHSLTLNLRALCTQVYYHSYLVILNDPSVLFTRSVDIIQRIIYSLYIHCGWREIREISLSCATFPSHSSNGNSQYHEHNNISNYLQKIIIRMTLVVAGRTYIVSIMMKILRRQPTSRGEEDNCYRNAYNTRFTPGTSCSVALIRRAIERTVLHRTQLENRCVKHRIIILYCALRHRFPRRLTFLSHVRMTIIL